VSTDPVYGITGSNRIYPTLNDLNARAYGFMKVGDNSSKTTRDPVFLNVYAAQQARIEELRKNCVPGTILVLKNTRCVVKERGGALDKKLYVNDKVGEVTLRSAGDDKMHTSESFKDLIKSLQSDAGRIVVHYRGFRVLIVLNVRCKAVN
jgi:hypothetical protein